MNQGLQMRINHENRKNEVSTPSEVRKRGLILTIAVRQASPGDPSSNGCPPHWTLTLTSHIRHLNWDPKGFCQRENKGVG